MTSTETPKPRSSGKRRPDLDTLYSINPDGSHHVIHPADVKGRWQRRKKLVWAILILIYAALPWIRIGGHPAVLIDLPNRHFYLFGGVYDAADFNLFFFFVAGLGITLYIVSAVFGRVWCGFACPHTVFLEAWFRRIERWIEGGANKRERLAKMPWNAEKLLKRGSKHAIFVLLSLVISHVFLSYFIPARELIHVIGSDPSQHWTAFVFILLFTAILYFDFAFFREQLCLIICPYGRLQSALYDRDTMQVGYDKLRGEPRGHYSQEGTGSCIDCFRCVAVCPTGIDIRNGTQMECIGCANCIDACDEVMARIGEEPGLIRYDSERSFLEGLRRFWRPRLIAYGGAVLLLFVLFFFMSRQRTPFDAKPIRLEGPAYLLVGEDVMNRFRIHLVNKLDGAHTFVLVPLNESETMRYELSQREITLQQLEGDNIGVVVRVPRSVYREGMFLEVEVRGGGETVLARAPLSGPEN